MLFRFERYLPGSDRCTGTHMVSIRSGHVSITGNFRENNEDSVVVDESSRYFIIADGMGGQNAGEKASQLAIELISQQLENRLSFDTGKSSTIVESIDAAIDYANSEIMALSELDPSVRNMGTTVVFVICVGGQFYIGGVGDSRVYQLHSDKLIQQTTDHSLTQALLDAGTITPEEAEHHRYKNVLYRYLGTRDGAAGTDAQRVTPVSGDRFLLCSDGVTDGIKDARIQTLLNSSDDPQEVAGTIVDAALEGGSRDNITCVVLIVD
ncbi:MAG: protein phosphatase 2C domain-containing protein [Fuerstiella sp.]|nr:protein phosphatase 2C domain-containing protein [Fuerstiella sp.]